MSINREATVYHRYDNADYSDLQTLMSDSRFITVEGLDQAEEHKPIIVYLLSWELINTLAEGETAHERYAVKQFASSLFIVDNQPQENDGIPVTYGIPVSLTIPAQAADRIRKSISEE